ncbi:MAG: hypothetical protein PUC00_03840 [Clostridiales bacterium]|nr:hypothetical protein [Clostridiales bacterium]
MAALKEQLRRQVYALREGNGLVLVNSLPWARQEWVELPDGRELYASLPADGVTMADAALPQPEDASAAGRSDSILLENRYLSLTLDRAGRIIALTDKENGAALLQPGQRMNDRRLYQNVEAVYDACARPRLLAPVRHARKLPGRAPGSGQQRPHPLSALQDRHAALRPG